MCCSEIKDVMIFPYSKNMVNIVKYKEQLTFNIKSIVSPESWALAGKDPLYISEKKSSEFIISSDFEGELKKADTVLLGSFKKYYGDSGIRDKYIGLILDAGKNVILLDDEYAEPMEKFERAFENAGKRLIPLKAMPLKVQVTNKPAVPVIGVFGIEEDCGKLDMQLLIVTAIREMGYKVSMVGANRQLELLGGHVYPPMLYSEEKGDNTKIKALRAYVNSITAVEQPDLLVFSAPYGLNGFGDEKVDYKYNGLLSHIIIEALQPDANFFCINAGRDIRWALRSSETLARLSSVPTLAACAKRFNRKPQMEYHKLDVNIKTGFLDDAMFELYTKAWADNVDMPLLDQDNTSAEQIFKLIADALDIQIKENMMI